MKKLLVVLAMMILVAPALAVNVPSVTIQTINGPNTTLNPGIANTTAIDNFFGDGSTGLLTVTVAFNALNGYTYASPISGIDCDLTLNGAGVTTGNIIVDDNNIASSGYAALNSILPAGNSYVWGITSGTTNQIKASSFGGVVTTNPTAGTAAADPAVAMDFVFNDTYVSGTHDKPVASLTNGMVMFIFQFDYTGTFTSFGQQVYATATSQDDTFDGITGTTLPAIYFTDAQGVGMTVTDQGTALMTPEPATMGLLGLGLVGLVIRRKKA